MNLDEIGADIRNKLTPMKNLLALLETYNAENDELKREILMKYIIKEIEASKFSIEYLTNLL